MNTSLIDRLAGAAAASPDHDAVVTPAIALTYAQLLQLVEAQAASFIDSGISSDDTIGILCADEVTHLIMCLASCYVGAASCTLPSDAADEARKAVADACRVTRVIDETMAVDSSSIGVRAQRSAPSGSRLLFSTSGTTGEPKMVVHRDAGLVAQAHRHVQSEHERFACLASIEHNFAKRHRLYCVAMGATNVFVDANPDTLVEQCKNLGVNVLHVSAFQAQELLAAENIGALAGIRLKLGGSHATLALRKQLREGITHNLQAGYGTTETGAIGFTDPGDAGAGAGESVGQPLPGIEVRAVAPDRTPLAQGERGEIAIRCDGMFEAYLGKPELTAERLEDGWFFTGDVGYLDEQQRIHLCGRADDMFVFNSMNIYPHDLEAQICQFPGVTEAAVVPKPSTVHGNIPLALVVFADGADADLAALKKFMRQRVGPRAPRQFTCVDEIPRNATGKISRDASLQVHSRAERIRSAIVDTLNTGERQRLSKSQASAFIDGEGEIPLREIDLDSLARMDLMVMLEVEFDAVYTPEEFNRLGSLAEVCASALSRPGTCEAADHPPTVSMDMPEAYVVRFFQRVLRYCPTVAHLHRALGTLDHRLTPLEVDRLQAAFRDGHLVPAGTATKFRAAIAGWLSGLERMMRDSGKRVPEPYESRRVRPAAVLFVGSGNPRDKTLLVCFPGKGARLLAVPNAVWLQNMDASQYDVLMIAEPRAEGYRLGIPLLGKNIAEVAQSIGELAPVRDYARIRTVGYSAGGHAAIVAAYRLGAELGVSIAGRFHSERYPGRILRRLMATWRAARYGTCERIVLAYAADKTRDRNFARIVGNITGAYHFTVGLEGAGVGHHVLNRVSERGQLGSFLTATVFADLVDFERQPDGTEVVMRLRKNSARDAISQS